MPNQRNAPFIRRLWRLIRGIFTSEVKWHALSLLLTLIAFAILITGINVWISYINSWLFTALQSYNQSKFFEYLFYLITVFILATPVTALYSYTEQRLGLLWRKWLTRDILKKYFNQESFYKINWHEGIDNPDQRIEEDIRTLTTSVLSLFIVFINSVLTLVMFTRILWTINWHLIVGALSYTLVGSFLTFIIGKRLISLNFTQLKKEGDFRYKLVNIRDNAESIAFYKSSKKEYTRTRQKLRDALSNQLRIIFLNLQLGPFVNFYNYLKPLIPIIIVAPAFFRGDIKEWGTVPQSADAFVRVVEALSVLIQNFGLISTIAAVTTRLGAFTETLENAAEESSCYFPRINTTFYDDKIEFNKVTIHTPRVDNPIIKDLSFSHTEGGLLITGPSGKGKTSILRVLSGIWVFGEGAITRPKPEDCLFIPQKPYLILGSLRNQLLYASEKSGFSDSELEGILKEVGLKNLLRRLKGFDKVHDWTNLLSSGEQQQLGFARYLIKKPAIVFLDEATTAVDHKTESKLYDLVAKHSKTWISVGYREGLENYHKKILEIKDDGTYEIN